jgi:endonuclease YncB( thermonuclease family)
VRRPLLTLLASLALALAIAPAAIAKAHRGPCLPGDPKSPKCLLWSGKATFIADGDTLDVDIAGDGTARPKAIRLIGLNATELRVYSRVASRRRGECHGVPAANEMERLVRGSHWRVRLSAMHANGGPPGKRLHRGLQVRINGRWRDAGEILVGRGDALWMPNVGEWWSRGYSKLSQQAAAARRGIFDRKQCGHEPEPSANLRLRVIWDGTAGDLNGEFIEVTNADAARPVKVGGWWLRDSYITKYRLPRGTTIPPGGRLRLHTGRGRSSGNNLFWGYTLPLFGFEGDGGYLFDSRSNLRAWMMYPCHWNCVDPLQGKIRLTASPGGDEHVLLRNISAAPVDLRDYVLGLPFHAYEFGAGSVLDPGQTMRVDVQGDPRRSTPLHRYYGYSRPLLADGGQRVVLRSYSDVIVACDAWGSFSC